MANDRRRGLELLGIDLERMRNGATVCPKCSDDRKKSRQRCLSVNLVSGNVNCSHCGWQARADSDEWLEKKANVTIEKDDYQFTDFVTTPQHKEGISFLKYRGISDETIRRFRIAGDGTNIIFNYYQDDRIVLAKYRMTGEKKFFSKGKARSLYNVDALKGRKDAIIVEGEIDALSFHEAGFPNAVSLDYGVPKVGAQVGAKLDCIKACAKQLEKIERFYLATDIDQPGLHIREELSRRLGRERCFMVDFPEDCKDANDVLIKHGIDVLTECINNAKPIPVTGIITLQDVWPEIVDQFRNGLKKGITTGIPCLEGHFSWLPGETSLFTGLPNSGKSEMVKFMLCQMIKNHGWKVAVFSPETYPASSFYFDWIHTLTGENPDKDYPNQISFDEFKMAAETIKASVYYVYPEGNEQHTPDVIRSKIKELTLIHGLNAYVLDPWNMLLHSEMGSREDLYISDQMTQFAKINHEHDLHGIIVAHPKSIPSDTVPNPYHHISGGPMFINKCDNCIVVHRPNYSKDKQDRQVDFMIEKIRRQKLVGIPTTVSFAYDRRTAQYDELHSNQFPVTPGKMAEEIANDDDEGLPF